MKTIRFYLNSERAHAAEIRGKFAKAAERCGFSVKPRGETDVVIALGGDGTFLRAVHKFPDSPVLGINLGSLGYLASVEERDFGSAMSKLAHGRYRISERSMLSVNGNYAALNDVVLMRELSGHSARLDLRADGSMVAHYMADGLIFATPTGSTAYSLSAGGPVLMPDSGSVVVTPMNPHALGVRPLVMRDDVRFQVTSCLRTPGNSMKIGVYVDGEDVLTLDEGDSVEIAKSDRKARLVELEGYDPFGVLSRKLGWSGSNVK